MLWLQMVIMKENKNESEILSIPLNVIERLKSEVVEKLGVESIFKLNDKLDGVFYLNKQLKRVLALYIIEKYLKIKILDNDKLINTKSNIIINNKKIHVIGVDYNDNIKIPKIDVDLFLIVGFLYNHQRARVLGCITQDESIILDQTKESKNSVVSKQIVAVIKKENLKIFSNDTTK